MPNGPHTFYIVRGPTGSTWQFVIDGILRAELGFFANHTADYVVAGLESYESASVSPAKSWTSLRYFNGSAWTSWSGQEVNQVDNPPHCGRYLSNTTWRPAENSPC